MQENKGDSFASRNRKDMYYTMKDDSNMTNDGMLKEGIQSKSASQNVKSLRACSPASIRRLGEAACAAVLALHALDHFDKVLVDCELRRGGTSACSPASVRRLGKAAAAH